MRMFDPCRKTPGHHKWVGWEPLVEPGISDVDGGMWGRVAVRCRKCGERRQVWRSVDRTNPGLINGCTGVRVELEDETSDA